jgi:hypothetical protein
MFKEGMESPNYTREYITNFCLFNLNFLLMLDLQHNSSVVIRPQSRWFELLPAKSIEAMSPGL